MAAEAILKIKQAEDEGRELVRFAGEKARGIALDAEKDLTERKNAVLREADKKKAEIISIATKKANEDCEALERQGESERRAILDPGEGRFDKAVKSIVERIVGV